MKILLTELQCRLLENGYSDQILSLRDLGKIVGRLGYDDEGVELWIKIFISRYKRHGDDGVIDLFKSATGLTIEPISRGKYIFAYTLH